MKRQFCTCSRRLASKAKAERTYNFVKPGSATSEAVSVDLLKPKVDPQWPECSTSSFAVENVGNVYTHHPRAQNLFKTFGLPTKLAKEFDLTSKPPTVLRTTSAEIHQGLQAVEDANTPFVKLLVGSKTSLKPSGCSSLLLQAISYASLKNWIILSIPNAATLIDSSAPFQFDPESNLYIQNTAALNILKGLQDANKDLLGSLGAISTANGQLQINQIISQATLEPEIAWDTLQKVLEVLATQTKHPFLLTLDSAQALFGPSRYQEPLTEKYLPAYALALPRLLLQYITGQIKFQRGAILYATSSSLSPFHSKELEYRIQNPDNKSLEPYSRLSKEYWDLVKGIPLMKVDTEWTIKEAAGLFKMLADSRQLRTGHTDRTFLESYLASGKRAEPFIRSIKGTMGFA